LPVSYGLATDQGVDMSDMASTPFSETKAPESAERLHRAVRAAQHPHYSWFPYAALGILIVSVIYAAVLTRRDPGLGERVGSIVADE
jgi:hypothetical protein